MNDSVGEIADSSSASDDEEVLFLEVPSLVHSNYKFDFLAFKEWHQINGCRFAPWITARKENLSTVMHCRGLLLTTKKNATASFFSTMIGSSVTAVGVKKVPCPWMQTTLP